MPIVKGAKPVKLDRATRIKYSAFKVARVFLNRETGKIEASYVSGCKTLDGVKRSIKSMESKNKQGKFVIVSSD